MACVEAEVANLATCEHVPTVDASELSPAQFVERFMKPNLPALLTGLTNGWRAQREWVVGGESDGISMAAMTSVFGDADVLVVDCDAGLDTDLARKQMKFSEYARFWTSRGVGAEGCAASDGGSGGGGDGRRLYLKDWTFTSDFPAYGAYETPPHFADDWLNAYWDERAAEAAEDAAEAADNARHRGAAAAAEEDREAKPQREGDAGERESGGADGVDADVKDAAAAEEEEEDDAAANGDGEGGGGTHRFVYVGVAGTWTPLHADVLRSFSWSVNVAGSKRWLMVPPQRSRHLLSRDGTRRPKDLREAMKADPEDADNDFPEARKAAPLVVEQAPGAVLFVPSLWYHQVHNLTDCVSINHNWLNAANARVCWAMLRDETSAVREGLLDPEDRCDGVLCQQLVARRAGADYPTFAGMLVRGGDAAVSALCLYILSTL
jgi:hypothetical protein